MIGVAGSSNNALTPLNLNQTMKGLGFRPVDPFGLLAGITKSFGLVIQEVFSWVYFLAEVGVFVGLLVFIGGAIGHNARVRRTGSLIVLYAILGFFAAVILPGVIVAIDSHFRA